MANKKTIIALAVLASLASVSTVVSAQSDGLYFGVSGGQSKASKAPGGEVTQQDVANAFDNGQGRFTDITSNFKTNKKDSSYKIFVGQQMNKNIAFETGFASLGKFSNKGQISGVYNDDFNFSANGKVNSSSTAWFADVLGMAPLADNFSLFGKVGIAYVKTKSKASASVFETGNGPVLVDRYSDSASKSRWVPKIGLGAEYSINKSVAVRAEYERYLKVGSKSVGFRSDVDMMTVGLKVSF